MFNKANVGLACCGVTWFAANVAQINSFIQFFILVCSATSIILSLWWKIKAKKNE